MTRYVASLFSVCTLVACGASDTSPGGGATGGIGGAVGGGGITGASGGAVQTTGTGGTVAPGNGGATPAAGGALPGSGGAVPGAGGTVPGAGGAAAGGVTGSGGATPGCDDNALASAGKVCNPTGNPCNIHSGYAGDEFCILPPPEGKGIQIHFGPSDYSNPTEVAKYLIKPSQEFNAYGLATIPGAGQKYYNYVQIRMRPGSHHLINELVTGVDSTPDGFVAGRCPGSPAGSFPGTQNLVRNMPPGGQQAPENKGLGSQLSADAKLCVNHHGYNYDDSGDQLREVWINVWFVDESEVTQKTTTIMVNAGPLQGIPAHTQRALKTTATVTGGDGRIVNLFGHRHAHTERFAVWQNDVLVYDSWDWKESIAFDYNSITQNPPLNPDAKKDGAVSGQLPVKLGDRIAIECDVNNTSDQTLTFKNELYTGEMCILFGATVGAARIGGGLF